MSNTRGTQTVIPSVTSSVLSSSLVLALVLLTGCEIDMEDGIYQAQVVADNLYGDGTRQNVGYTAEMRAQLGQDAGGIAPDLMVFTLCNDLIAAASTQPCSEPIEVAVRNNHFGGEHYAYGDFSFATPSGTCSGYGYDLIVLSGDLISPTEFEFTLSLTAELDFYEDYNGGPSSSECKKEYPYPVQTQISGVAILQ